MKKICNYLLVSTLCLFGASFHANAEVLPKKLPDGPSSDAYLSHLRTYSDAELNNFLVQKSLLTDAVLDFHSGYRMADYAKTIGLLDDPDVKARIERHTRNVLNAALSMKLADSVSMNNLDELAKERYSKYAKDLRVPERRRVAQIFIRNKAPDAACPCLELPEPEDAEQLRLRILSGDIDFATAAREYSDDPRTARFGGELPKLVQKGGGISRELEKMIFSMNKVGEVSDVFEQPTGKYIFKLLELQPEHLPPYEVFETQLKSTITAELKAQPMTKLRSNAYPDPNKIDYQQLHELIEKLLAERTSGQD